MRYLLVLLVAFFACFQTNAAGTENLYWKKANLFYEQKQYDSAAFYYEQIVRLQPHDAHVYYNLGNAYYRLNLVGPAVLNYEKALHARPSYKEAADNLALTQSRISNRIQPIPEIFFVRWWHQLTCAGMAGVWAFVCAAIFLALIGLLIAQTLKKIRKVPSQLLVALGCINILVLVFAVSSATNMADSKRGVVMQNDAPIYSTPAQGKATNLVPEGTTVDITGDKAAWMEIKLPDGRTGWIEKSLVSRI